ncbi:MAG: lipoprotein NlpC precursor [Chitinophagaceae bacterium]|nr:lipoprotein NlpC precursor [Chitinophagaceae bacterium]
MKKIHILYSLFSVAMFTSCKALKTLPSRDSSSASTNSSAKKAAREIKFLDGIALKPSDAQGVKKNKRAVQEKPVLQKRNNNIEQPISFASFNIENANWLQLKYAIILDATVEKLTNVSLLKTIDTWWGTKYCMGGNTQDCIDCSSFTQVLMHDVYNLVLPRTAQEQYDRSERVDMENLQEGDLVFFHTEGREVSHVGMYLLNNKFVHASTSGGVSISDLNDNYWKPRYRGAGRMPVVSTTTVSTNK